MNALLTAETEADLLRGITWFEKIAIGLGDQFESEFYIALARIKQDPNLFAANHTGYRPCKLQRFTAVIYFRIEGNLIVVVGLFTSGEDETVLQKRS
ncbi:MAG: type II toxin-antitoxin system RelE/ParE family toxin [Planctomycetota bacterium]|nr:type II toxin-antitoxin system RelE/ParE family toxin [Planctomycetota bacterium]